MSKPQKLLRLNDIKWKVIGLLLFWLFSFSNPTTIHAFKPCTYTVNQEDEQLAKEIYNQLKKVIGDTRKDWPILEIVSVKETIAQYNPSYKRIYLEEEAVKVCKSLKGQYKAALAFLIGHELTHFYQRHDWEPSGFAAFFMTTITQNKDGHRKEKQADIYGTFLAERAGFAAIKSVEPFLKKVYLNYGFSKKANAKYPSLDDRIQLAKEASELTKNLLAAYQTANYAMVLGKYEEAHSLYQYVGEHLKFKELYFNLGMSNLLAYYDWDKRNQLSYNFEIDPKIPLTRSGRKRHPDTLLHYAVNHFQKITTDFDSTYLAAKIHLITAYDWSGLTEQARMEIHLLEKQITAPYSANFVLTIANFHARNKELAEAQRSYKDLVSKKEIGQNIQTIAKENLTYLQTGKSAKAANRSMQTLKIEKNIDGIPSLTFFEFNQSESNQSIPIDHQVQLSTWETPNSYLTQLFFENSLFKLQRVYKSAASTNQGIKIGDSLKQLQNAYPKQMLGRVNFIDGYYLVHYEKGLIFKCTLNNLVEEWVVFTF